MRALVLRAKIAGLRAAAAIERAFQPPLRCFEAGCEASGTYRIRVILRAEHGERVDIVASVIVPAVLCREHAHAEEPLLARDVLPRADRRRLTTDLERGLGVPLSWDRSTVEIRHRFLAWLLWRAA